METLYQMKDVKPNEKYLQGFEWLILLRPMDRNDIFLWDRENNTENLGEEEKKVDNDSEEKETDGSA